MSTYNAQGTAQGSVSVAVVAIGLIPVICISAYKLHLSVCLRGDGLS